jgi:hypothetical protein
VNRGVGEGGQQRWLSGGSSMLDGFESGGKWRDGHSYWKGRGAGIARLGCSHGGGQGGARGSAAVGI